MACDVPAWSASRPPPAISQPVRSWRVEPGRADPVASFVAQVAAFLIQRNRSALLGRSMDEQEMQELMHLLKADPVSSARVQNGTVGTPAAAPIQARAALLPQQLASCHRHDELPSAVLLATRVP